MRTVGRIGLALALGVGSVSCDSVLTDGGAPSSIELAPTTDKTESIGFDREEHEERMQGYKDLRERLEEDEKKAQLESCQANLLRTLKLVEACLRSSDQAHELAFTHSDQKNNTTHLSRGTNAFEDDYLPICQSNTKTALTDLELCLSGIESKLDYALEQ